MRQSERESLPGARTVTLHKGRSVRRCGNLLLLVNPDVVDRLALAIRALGGDGPRLAIARDNVGASRRNFPGLLAHRLDSRRVDARANDHVGVWIVACDAVVIPVIVPGVLPVSLGPIRLDLVYGNLDARVGWFDFNRGALGHRIRTVLRFRHVEIPSADVVVGLSESFASEDNQDTCDCREERRLPHSCLHRFLPCTELTGCVSLRDQCISDSFLVSGSG